MKFYEIKPEVQGMPAKISYEIHNSSASLVTVSFGFYASQTSSALSIPINLSVPANTKYTRDGEPVAVPNGAKYIGVNIQGNATAYVYRLDVDELPFVEREIDGTSYVLQNGYLAFVTLQPNFYVFDLPARNVEINGAPAFVRGIQKKKKQEVSFPVGEEPNLTQLVKTNIGNGAIEKMSLVLHSRMAKITLKYDTE